MPLVPPPVHLCTAYTGLPRRARQAAKNDISTVTPAHETEAPKLRMEIE